VVRNTSNFELNKVGLPTQCLCELVLTKRASKFKCLDLAMLWRIYVPDRSHSVQVAQTMTSQGLSSRGVFKVINACSNTTHANHNDTIKLSSTNQSTYLPATFPYSTASQCTSCSSLRHSPLPHQLLNLVHRVLERTRPLLAFIDAGRRLLVISFSSGIKIGFGSGILFSRDRSIAFEVF
jgi:hypothetical protein